jgi:hypothetical protein
MVAITKAFSRALETQGDTETFKITFIFCGVGLTASLVLAICGLDLSAGFF